MTESAEEADDASVPPAQASAAPERNLLSRGRPKWADEHPWMFNLILLALPVVVLGVWDQYRQVRDPVPVRTAVELQDYRYTLQSVECVRSVDREGESLDSQTCTAAIDIRNNSRESKTPSADYTLFIGEDRYSPDNGVVYPAAPPSEESLFPGNRGSFYKQFVIPLGASPSALQIEESLSEILPNPLDRDAITYELG